MMGLRKCYESGKQSYDMMSQQTEIIGATNANQTKHMLYLTRRGLLNEQKPPRTIPMIVRRGKITKNMTSLELLMGS